jgi:enoyl-CoA hydratase/carnithine racemase
MAITFEKDGRLGLVKINRPPANAYDGEFFDQLDQAIEQARGDAEVRAVLLLSEVPRFFSAGADVKFFQRSTPAQRAQFVAEALRSRWRATSGLRARATTGSASRR